MEWVMVDLGWWVGVSCSGVKRGRDYQTGKVVAEERDGGRTQQLESRERNR